MDSLCSCLFTAPLPLHCLHCLFTAFPPPFTAFSLPSLPLHCLSTASSLHQARQWGYLDGCEAVPHTGVPAVHGRRPLARDSEPKRAAAA